MALWMFATFLPSASGATERFPVPIESLDEKGREKVEGLLRDHTIMRSPRMEHPILNRPLHQFLLDRPDVGAALARILRIGTYTITPTGTDQFRASDPEGLEGELEILYRDAVSRVYFAHGIAEGGILRVRGKVVVCQESRYGTTAVGQERVATQLTIYAKIENPVLAFLVKILSPFIGGMVDAKITKAQGVVRQVSELMVQDPYETYTRIAQSNQLAPEDLATVRTLMRLAAPLPIEADLP
jgi:hypothetical protein